MYEQVEKLNGTKTKKNIRSAHKNTRSLRKTLESNMKYRTKESNIYNNNSSLNVTQRRISIGNNDLNLGQLVIWLQENTDIDTSDMYSLQIWDNLINDPQTTIDLNWIADHQQSDMRFNELIEIADQERANRLAEEAIQTEREKSKQSKKDKRTDKNKNKLEEKEWVEQEAKLKKSGPKHKEDLNTLKNHLDSDLLYSKNNQTVLGGTMTKGGKGRQIQDVQQSARIDVQNSPGEGIYNVQYQVGEDSFAGVIFTIEDEPNIVLQMLVTSGEIMKVLVSPSAKLKMEKNKTKSKKK